MNLKTFEDVKNLVENEKIKAIEINYFLSGSKMYYHETNDGINLYFTANWCEQNEELLNKILIYIINRYNEKKLTINSGNLINDDVIKEISLNTNIEEVSFGNFFDPYILKESDYLILRKTIKKISSNDVEEGLKYNFDEIIEYNRKKNLISYYKYSDLQKGILYIMNPIDKDQIEYFNCIGDDTQLVVSAGVNIIDIINKLRKIGKNNTIIYRLGESKKQFNEKLFENNINCENVFIEVGTEKYSLKDYIEYEKILFSFIEPAQDLSPFEKYIYAYDIVKKFKKYKENKKDKMKARRIYDILNNNYMVCVAYSDLLGDLLDKLGIENINYSVFVGLQSYKAQTQLKNKYQEEWNEMDKQKKFQLIDEQKSYIPDSWGGHARRLIHIVDDKYGINGLYFSDPTWDNDLENNSYNYLLMTSNEVLNSGKKFKFLNTSYELFHCSSIKEFNDKLNVILNRTKITQYMNQKIKLEYILRDLLMIIRKLDSKFYEKLYKKYEFIQNNNFKIDDIYIIPEEIINFLYDVATYISINVNKAVDGKIILEAVKNVYDTIYVGGISKQELEEIQQYNSELSERNFGFNRFK